MIKYKSYWRYIFVLLLVFEVLPSQAQSIIPMPKEITVGEGNFKVSLETRINYNDKSLAKTVALFNDYMDGRFGMILKNGSSGRNTIHLQLDKKMPAEAYSLTVNDKGVTIKGNEAGVFYGIQTLQQLLETGQNAEIQLPSVIINDEPRFGYRGLMLDVARYFYSVDYVKESIDLMSRYKINRFHWHLTEDAGWRIEIKKHPELTRIGAWRNSTQWGHNPAEQDRIPHGGFYTQEQIKDIIRYAADRYITIVPEIDLPGHTMSVLAAYPNLSCTGGPFLVPETWGIKEEVLCLGNKDTYQFVEEVLSEVIDLFPGEYIHIGGDEAPKRRWKECSKCQQCIKDNHLKDEHELQSYFIHHLDEFVTKKGRKIIGWDEILEGGLAPNAAVMSWRGEAGGIAAAGLGHKVVMAPNNYMYIDYYQSKDHANEPLNIGGLVTLEHTYSYEPYTSKLTKEQCSFIMGVQANLWGEFVHHPDKANYMAYPRAIALSEIGWSPIEKKDYASFSKRLSSCLADLDRQGVTFRIPEPIGWDKAVVNGNAAIVNLEPSVAGAEIYYTVDGTDPRLYGKLYANTLQLPLSFNGVNVKCYLRLPSGRSSAIYTVRTPDMK
ncbi:family 20 glycosylhydrolase [Bacteroides sp.]|uniref:family 20 glycosylhydrolase n=1 Tax=Bacteroides sp. TaxID=29523 RepID=UPI0026199EAE|nr:family 20 glycosylhydrolase [Bacteroides sp.]